MHANIFQLIIFALYFYIIFWIFRLEKSGCKCSANWRREFIKFWMIIAVITIFFNWITHKEAHLTVPALMVTAIVNIIFVIIVYQYVHGIKHSNCPCAEGAQLNVLEVYNYVQIGLLLLSVMIIVSMYIRVGLALAILKKVHTK